MDMKCTMWTLDFLAKVSLMSEDIFRDIATTLKDILRWTRFAGMQQLRTILSQNFKTDVEMLVYELSDGTRSTRDIARLIGIGSHATVAVYWKKWNELGIVEPSPIFRGRYKRICSLEEVGLTVPPMPSASTTPQTEPEKEGGTSNE